MQKFLLYSSALVVLSGAAEAACIQTPTCSSLGYTSSSSCSGGVKCPFGNAWNCSINDIKTEFNNKITELEATIKKIQQGSNNENKVNCKVGDILYDDFSCNANVVYTKEPIGVVFDVTNYLAVALEEKNDIQWATTAFDTSILGLSSASSYDGWGKKNTRVIYEYCKANGKSCPAVEYAYEYKTAGTSAGDWHLPSYVELAKIMDNFDTLNYRFSVLNKTQMEETGGSGSRYKYYYYWTSTGCGKSAYVGYKDDHSSSYDFECVKQTSSNVIGNMTYIYISRPVIAF